MFRFLTLKVVFPILAVKYCMLDNCKWSVIKTDSIFLFPENFRLLTGGGGLQNIQISLTQFIVESYLNNIMKYEQNITFVYVYLIFLPSIALTLAALIIRLTCSVSPRSSCAKG